MSDMTLEDQVERIKAAFWQPGPESDHPLAIYRNPKLPDGWAEDTDEAGGAR